MLKDSLLEKLCNRIRENRVDGARELGERIMNDWVVETFPQSPSQQAIIGVLLEPILFDTLVDTERNSESHCTSLAHLMGSNLLQCPNDWMNQYILPLLPKEILPSNSKSSSDSKAEGNENAAESSSTMINAASPTFAIITSLPPKPSKLFKHFRCQVHPKVQFIQTTVVCIISHFVIRDFYPEFGTSKDHAELYLPEESNSGGNP
ncbi:hypothetical protein F5876DRAFT_68441 [Lentinula aff. lateritia]|uniref:Uncharacterized protein n=1 Tax=Lentinula aff. lateritia TaxID=2804960 RepID=A0ACC1TQN2_9AGAR|nr:hypothetical protein F5876DRAFT_68441 [Lentinula aff. lateritia]